VRRSPPPPLSAAKALNGALLSPASNPRTSINLFSHVPWFLRSFPCPTDRALAGHEQRILILSCAAAPPSRR